MTKMVLIRKNRLLQILFCLLLFTFLTPILLNVLVSYKTNQQQLQQFYNIQYSDKFPLVAKYYGGKKSMADDHPNQNSNADLIMFPPISNLNLSYAKMVAGDSLDIQLAYRFADLSNRVKYAEMIAGERREEIYYLLQEIRNLWMVVQQNKRQQQNLTINEPKISINFNESIKNLSFFAQNSSSMYMQEQSIQLPSLLSLMSHLTSSTSLNPAFYVASSHFKKSFRRFVFGLPTVKRLVESYLISTLRDLIKNLSPIEQEQSLFVVFIAETDLEFVRKTADDIINHFKKEIDSGLIEIISPPTNLYPDFSQLKQTLGDPIERVRWRSKQNFDFAYLMMYCRPKGTYYVQLEDDIITKPSYLTKIENFIAKNALTKRDWLILDFCSLGFIGKLFRTIDLSHFVLFFMMFYNDKPVDWLLDNYVQTKVCRFDKDIKDCKKRKDSIWITHKPSLFQHIGTHSSLKGKIQKLRDKGFGKVKLFEPHADNPPPSKHYSTMKYYQKYSLIDAYEGRNFFWAVSPIQGAVFGFKYEPPVNLESCLIQTGNPEHPLDILYNATFQIRPVSINSDFKLDKITEDGFVDLAHFDPVKGKIDVRVPEELNPIQELRVRIDQNLTNWVIVNEIHIKELKQSKMKS